MQFSSFAEAIFNFTWAPTEAKMLIEELICKLFRSYPGFSSVCELTGSGGENDIKWRPKFHEKVLLMEIVLPFHG